MNIFNISLTKEQVQSLVNLVRDKKSNIDNLSISGNTYYADGIVVINKGDSTQVACNWRVHKGEIQTKSPNKKW